MASKPVEYIKDPVIFVAERVERRQLWGEYVDGFEPASPVEKNDLEKAAQRAFDQTQGMLKLLFAWGADADGTVQHPRIVLESAHPHAKHSSVALEMLIGGNVVHVVRKEYLSMGRIVFSGGYGSYTGFNTLPQDLKELFGFMPECTVWNPRERFASHVFHGREDVRRLAGTAGVHSLITNNPSMDIVKSMDPR